VEASGSPTSGYLINAIRQAGAEAIGSDVVDFTCAECLADGFLKMPFKNDPDLWEKVTNIIKTNRIDIVIPSFDEMMIGWAERQAEFEAIGCRVIISPLATIEICQDKWKTYEFFRSLNIPTPKTSLSQVHPLVKPRLGRGGQGVKIEEKMVDMTDMISQEVLTGEEFTVDVFFDCDHRPVYIIPRRRSGVVNGKSTSGEVVKNNMIDTYILIMSENLSFVGPINFQCFVDGNSVIFIEINPRIAGGMALGFAASENWINLILGNILQGHKISPQPINYGLKMIRYYSECFVS
jgi:carbamoyl-phosphate synthase large subunit